MVECTVIGLTGPVGAGKSAVARLLSGLSSFPAVTLSAYVRALAERRGLVVTREVLQTLGQELRREGGPGAVARLALDELEQTGGGCGVIIDGIRSLGEIDELLAGSRRFFLIGVDAPQRIRYQRHLRRGYLVASHFQQFAAEDNKELGIGPEPAFEINACLARARSEPWGLVIVNDGGMSELRTAASDAWACISG